MSRRKTDADFKQEVYDLVGDEYTFLESYVNAKTKLKVKHNKCGNVYKITPNNFLHGSCCPYCNGGIKKNNEQFKKEVYDLVGTEYTFLELYVNGHTKIRVKHNKCGNVYKVTPNNFLHGVRCPYCSSKTKKTNEQFTQEVYDLVGNEYTFLDTYVNTLTRLRVKHNKCDNIYTVTPAHFISGSRCPYCNGNAKKTDTEFKQEVYDLVGNEYAFLDPYVNSATKIRVKHNMCGNVYEVEPNSFLRGNRCPYCSSTARKTNEQFKKEVFGLVGDEYIFLDPYVNADTKIKVKHNKCNTIYEVRPYSFLEGDRCPYCNSPKGETIISKILDTFDIDYEYQKTFDDLKDTQPLSYDFYIPSQSILIEYQGKQHYEPIDYFGGGSKFKLQQKHDQMKANYAKDHGYKLIAVPYTKDTFSNIKKYLLKHGLNN